MNEPIKEKLTRWSLERIRFLLSHIENFVENEDGELRERALNFSPQLDLESVTRLVGTDPADAKLPETVLQSLSPFFDAGLLLQSAESTGEWRITDLFWRGNTFRLQPEDSTPVSGLVAEITPLQVRHAPAARWLAATGMDFLLPGADAEAFLLRPTPSVAYVVLSRLPAAWAEDHVKRALSLVNKCFLY